MTRDPRIEPVSDAEATEAQRAVMDRLRRPDGTVLNIFRTVANHPDLARRWLVFGNHVLGKSTLSPRVRELVILRIGWRCHSEYEWGQHVLISRELDITESEIERLKCEPIDDTWTPAERAALVATDELHDNQMITDGTWGELEDHFSLEQRMDLVFAVGQYSLVSMALNTFGVERDPGVPGFAS